MAEPSGWLSPPGGRPGGIPSSATPVSGRSRRRRRLVAGLAAAAAVVVGGVGFIGGSRSVGDGPAAQSVPVTVTVEPPVLAEPVPLPTAVADRQTCATIKTEAVGRIHAASDAVQVIPEEMTILDPAVQEHPEWRASVVRAAQLYDEAGDVIAVAPGTAPFLAAAARTVASSLHALAQGYRSFDPASGNTNTAMKKAGETVDFLCGQVVPR